MRVTLSSRDTARWTSGAPAARLVEASVRSWATGAHITEPVVVVSPAGTVLFAFYLDETAEVAA